MKLRRLLRNLTLVLTGCTALVLTGCTNISPGNVGIVISKIGSSRGVQDVTLKTGTVVYNPFLTTIIEYPYSVQTEKWTKDTNEGKPVDESITFTTLDSAVVNCDVASSIQLDYDKVPSFYVKFRADEISTFVNGYYRNVVRNQLNIVGGNYSVEQVMGNNGPMLKQVEAAVLADVSQYGVQVTNLGFIGACRPPGVVTDSINAKLGAQQLALQKQNEVASAKADALKREAEADGIAQSNIIMATADAKANALKNQSLTPLLVEWKKIDKWDGQNPSVVSGAGGGSLMVSVK